MPCRRMRTSYSDELANIFFDADFKRARLALVRADDENRIVASDGAHHLRPIFVVDAGGDGLGGTCARDQDQLIHGLAHLDAEAAQHLADSGQAVLIVFERIPRHSVAGWPFRKAKVVNRSMALLLHKWTD